MVPLTNRKDCIWTHLVLVRHLWYIAGGVILTYGKKGFYVAKKIKVYYVSTNLEHKEIR